MKPGRLLPTKQGMLCETRPVMKCFGGFFLKHVKAAKDNFILGEVDDVMQVRQGQAGKAADISLLG